MEVGWEVGGEHSALKGRGGGCCGVKGDVNTLGYEDVDLREFKKDLVEEFNNREGLESWMFGLRCCASCWQHGVRSGCTVKVWKVW